MRPIHPLRWLRSRLADRRWALWALLVSLVALLLGTLIWLAGRYDISRVQEALEHDTAEAVSDIRAALHRNIQELQALPSGPGSGDAWAVDATNLLSRHREWLRLERRDASLKTLAYVETPYEPGAFAYLPRASSQADVALACTTAQKIHGAAYSASYYVPFADGLGAEVMDLCLPVGGAGRPEGYVVATYKLRSMLAEFIASSLIRGKVVALTEPDGARLAIHGLVRRGTRMFTAQHLLDLPGNAVMLRLDGWRSVPALFPNVLTALVATVSLALITVLALLGRDTRRRLRVERDLAEALAFRKAMEDSLVTGLRARDLEGRITYVNPAFCRMVGFEAAELLGGGAPAPYWPPERVEEYSRRQSVRLAGDTPPRDGFESVFMRRDGTRFPVLIIEAPLIQADGRQTGWMGAVVDISEQRRVEELSRASLDRLQATARLTTVGEMASLLSHELNQPLSAIASYATGSLNLLGELDEREGAAPGWPGARMRADLRMAMVRVGEQAERAGKVIKSVHDFVRRREQAREAVSAQTLLADIMPLVHLQARKLQVQVFTHVAPDLPEALCDRTMVEQVLLNLARNAMQAMADGDAASRVLRFEARRAETPDGPCRIEFVVADQGPGISEAVARQLFTPFFTTKAEGMGLGLSLCRTVVEQHGGRLDFAPGTPRGTVFCFTLPAAPEPIE